MKNVHQAKQARHKARRERYSVASPPRPWYASIAARNSFTSARLIPPRCGLSAPPFATN